MVNLKNLTEEELYSYEGGLIMWHQSIVEGIAEAGTLVYKAVSGSYQSGYDSAQNNCECQD